MKIEKLIGNTPIIKIRFKYKNIEKYVYVKLEYYNLTGSIKDRIALYILKNAKKNKKLLDNQPIIEATSGNTGISFSALGALYNHQVHIFMPDWVSSERVNIMKLYGAIIHLVSKEEGGFKECIRRADLLSKQINGYRPNQFDNYDNVMAHYYETAEEIINKIIPKGIVSGIGTGGTLIGISKRLKEINKDIKVIALEPDSLPILSKGEILSNHKIEGIGDDFIPSIVDRNIIDKVELINDNDAINMARKLSKELGLGVGISSGANFLAAAIQKESGYLTIFVDDSKKYLSTDLIKNIDNNSNFISNSIELIDFEVL